MRRVYIIIDGLTSLGLKYMPNLKKLVKSERSVSSSNVEPQTCSITHPNIFSILTGLTMEQHGIKTNDLKYNKEEVSKFKEIFSEAFPGRLNVYADTKGLDRLFKLCSNIHPRRILNLTEGFLKIKKTVSDTVIYTERLDMAGHKYGWLSEEYIKKLKSIDDELEFFLTPHLLENSQEGVVVIICSDHGGIHLKHTSKQCTNTKPGTFLNTDKRLKTVVCAFNLNHTCIQNIVLPRKPKTNTITKKLLNVR